MIAVHDMRHVAMMFHAADGSGKCARALFWLRSAGIVQVPARCPSRTSACHRLPAGGTRSRSEPHEAAVIVVVAGAPDGGNSGSVKTRSRPSQSFGRTEPMTGLLSRAHLHRPDVKAVVAARTRAAVIEPFSRVMATIRAAISLRVTHRPACHAAA